MFKQNPLRWILALTGEYLLVGFAMAAVYWSWWMLPVALVVIGTRQQGIFVLGHEGGHGLISRNKKVNDWLACLAFWPFGLGLSGYRRFHLAHHRNLGLDTDPEVFLKAELGTRYRLPATKSRVIGLCLLALVGDGAREIWYGIRHVVWLSSWFDRILPPVVMMVVSTVLYLNGLWLVSGLWYLSMLTVFPAVARARVWTEHQGTQNTNRFHVGPVWRLLVSPHNIWLHWEHHRAPGVPWWALPTVRAELANPPVQGLEELFSGFAYV